MVEAYIQWLYLGGTTTRDNDMGNITFLQFGYHVCFQMSTEGVKYKEYMLGFCVFDLNIRDPSIHPFGCTVMITSD